MSPRWCRQRDGNDGHALIARRSPEAHRNADVFKIGIAECLAVFKLYPIVQGIHRHISCRLLQQIPIFVAPFYLDLAADEVPQPHGDHPYRGGSLILEGVQVDPEWADKQILLECRMAELSGV